MTLAVPHSTDPRPPAVGATADNGTGACHDGRPRWLDVCALDRLEPERGVAALVGGVQVALFRLHDGSVHAIDHHDPCSGANVLARGIVGTRGGRPIVVSPMFKQAFDLHTGGCLDGSGRAVTVHAVRVRDGRVQVAVAGQPTGTGGRA